MNSENILREQYRVCLITEANLLSQKVPWFSFYLLASHIRNWPPFRMPLVAFANLCENCWAKQNLVALVWILNFLEICLGFTLYLLVLTPFLECLNQYNYWFPLVWQKRDSRWCHKCSTRAFIANLIRKRSYIWDTSAPKTYPLSSLSSIFTHQFTSTNFLPH